MYTSGFQPVNRGYFDLVLSKQKMVGRTAGSPRLMRPDILTWIYQEKISDGLNFWIDTSVTVLTKIGCVLALKPVRKESTKEVLLRSR